MDKLKAKTRSARNRIAEATSSGSGSGTLAVPHSSSVPHDNSSTHGVNEGYLGPQPGTAARDFAIPDDIPTRQPQLEPPTSLQSSVDAGSSVPIPTQHSTSRQASNLSSSSSAHGRARSSSAPDRGTPPPRRPTVGVRQSSIGIRRVPGPGAPHQASQGSLLPASVLNKPLPALDEDHALGHVASKSEPDGPKHDQSRLRKVKSAVQNRIPFWSSKDKGGSEASNNTAGPPQAGVPMDYTPGMVDVLDTLDPEVATLTSLTNVQNSLFIPNLPFFNRRPTYNLRRRQSETDSLAEINRIVQSAQEAQAQAQSAPTEWQAAPPLRRNESEGTLATVATIDSHLSDSRYAVLPSGTSLEGWSKEDKAEVNDHVRHMLHSKRSKFKRTMRGFGQYVKRPLGFLVTLYATLITIFGLAWVLFLIGWINVGGKQIYVVHVIDSVLVALFAVVGDGLAPFRAIDTYHMIYIAHYHHFTWSRRKKELLPDLHDHNDLPSTNAPISGPRTTDPEDLEKQWEFTVLSPKQQEKLEHHQAKFTKSHSFYKPHETETHYAFPLRLLIAIVVLLDCHSLLQISLGACTWGIYYKRRHPAITTVILICSITCNATAGLLIWIGDKRTRKNDVLERINRQELTEEAIQKVKEKKERESESEREDEPERRESKARMSLDAIQRFQSPHSGKAAKRKEVGGKETAP